MQDNEGSTEVKNNVIHTSSISMTNRYATNKQEIDPLISVVTVVYNAVITLEETILSVINQTYSNIEYIIIDGGSTDGTIEIIKKYEHKIAYWISEPDNGIYDAMNKGIEKATGVWLNFMNAGDCFYDYSIITKFLENLNPDSYIVFGDSQMILETGNYIRKAMPPSNKNHMPFVHQSVFSKTNLLKINRFETIYKICADHNFFYTVYNLGYKFQYIPVIISKCDAINGVSSSEALSDVIRKRYERGHMYGLHKKKGWQIKFMISIVAFASKMGMKKILPQSVVSIIKKRKQMFLNKGKL
ncbi:glycosyltransferase family 2 protein [Flavobacterium sp. GB2R13]|uniref:glycosyltransferase family 2 protein n=1 Tax=Flavobacterium algoris TaxID=3398733 RepID=UPI003A856CB4